MTIQDDHITKVVFAGTQFHVPFSHSPYWIEEAVDREIIWLDESTGKTYFQPGDIRMRVEVKPGDIFEFDKEDNEIELIINE